MTKDEFTKALFLLTLAAGVGLGGCREKETKPGKFQASLVHKIKESCKEDRACVIRLKDVTDFPWDQMFAFKKAVDQHTVEEALQTKVPPLQEGAQVVFVERGRIVLFEAEPWDLERPLPDDVIFVEDSDLKGYRVYRPEAILKVKKLKFDEVVQYKLDLVSETVTPAK